MACAEDLKITFATHTIQNKPKGVLFSSGGTARFTTKENIKDPVMKKKENKCVDS